MIQSVQKPLPWWQQSAPPPMPGTEEDPKQPPAPPQQRFDMPDEPQQAQRGFMPDMPQWQPQAMASAAPQGMPDEPGTVPAPAPAPIAPPKVDMQEDQAPPSSASGRPAPIARPYSVGPEPASPSPSAAPQAEDPRIAGDKEVMAAILKKSREHTPAWRQALAAALTFSPRTAGISKMVLNPPDKQEELAPLINQGAHQAVYEAQEKDNARLRQEQIEATKEMRLAAIEQRIAAQKGVVTPADRFAAINAHPEVKALLNEHELMQYVINGTVKESAGPTSVAPGHAVPDGKGGWTVPVAAPPQLRSVTPGGSLVDPAHPEKPVFTAPAKETPDKETVNQWIADSLDADPAISEPAKQKIAAWKGTQHDQRAPVVNVNAMPSDPAIDQAAVRYIKSGELPALGMGRDAATARTKILNRAAELDPSADIASNKSGYGADKASLASLQKTADTVNAFEGLARKNLDRFVGVAQKTIDSGQPWANRAFRGGARALGDKDAADFEAARVTAFTEVAKVLNNPTSSAVLSDSARREAEGILSGSYTVPQLMSVANLIKQEMATRKTENQRAIDEIKGRGRGGKKDGSEGGGGSVVKWGRDAQGNPIPIGQ